MTEQLYKKVRQAERTAPREALVAGVASQILTAIEYSEPFAGRRPDRPLADAYSVESHWKHAGFRQVLATEAIKGSELGLEGEKAEDHFGFVGVRSLGKIRRGTKPFGHDFEDFSYLTIYPHGNKEAQYQSLGQSGLMEMEQKDFDFVKNLADHLVPADKVPPHRKPR
ncbi:hypothetical protein HYW35_03020 [Candidatus Saccharibacteria bacterium]|nr:hypothetical protein [Candidatus Saccharibacteria bacterium]